MKVQNNISFKPYNTFGIDVKAKQFIEVNSLKELNEAIDYDSNYFLVGGGSNMLLTKDIEKTVLFINLKGKQIIKDNKFSVYVKVQAGEVWHDFVLWCIKNDFGGLENLSLIPGSVGASPIQNIGAYGVEVKNVIHTVNALEVATRKIVSFTKEDCNFGYRDSVFKNKLKNKYIITNVVFKLTKIKHKLHANYGAIQAELSTNNITTPTIKDVSDVVIKIRSSKLPNPKNLGNSGSFFKNPVVAKSVFEKIQKKHSTMPFYEVGDNIKIPAGWLIEQAGFKGKRYGDAGVHKNQALVLVNYGNATGIEIKALSDKIKQKIQTNFGIDLEIEVNVF